MTKLLTIKCLQCGQEFEVIVDAQEYQDYIDGNVSPLEALPSAHRVDRTLVIDHLCSRCYDDLFGVYEE